VRYRLNIDGLREMRERNRLSARPSFEYFYGHFMHSNPRFYKYYWSVYSFDSAKGVPTNHLCTSAAMERMSSLRERSLEYMVGNTKVLRLGSGIPIDLNHSRWVGYEFAPEFELDEDPLWNGHR